jgi:transposase-like protein
VLRNHMYVWSAVDVDSRELLALETSHGRSSLNALVFLRKALMMCTNKPLVDRGLWYPWTLQRRERFGMRNRVERFFKYLKKRMRARPHNTGSRTLKLFTLYHQAARTGRLSEKCIFGHYIDIMELISKFCILGV